MPAPARGSVRPAWGNCSFRWSVIRRSNPNRANGEAGIELSVARARLAVAGFYGRYDDLVTVQTSPGVFFGIDNLPDV